MPSAKPSEETSSALAVCWVMVEPPWIFLLQDVGVHAGAQRAPASRRRRARRSSCPRRPGRPARRGAGCARRGPPGAARRRARRPPGRRRSRSPTTTGRPVLRERLHGGQVAGEPEVQPPRAATSAALPSASRRKTVQRSAVRHQGRRGGTPSSTSFSRRGVRAGRPSGGTVGRARRADQFRFAAGGVARRSAPGGASRLARPSTSTSSGGQRRLEPERRAGDRVRHLELPGVEEHAPQPPAGARLAVEGEVAVAPVARPPGGRRPGGGAGSGGCARSRCAPRSREASWFAEITCQRVSASWKFTPRWSLERAVCSCSESGRSIAPAPVGELPLGERQVGLAHLVTLGE